MLITAVEKAKGARWNVFVEGELALCIDSETLMASGIKAGQEVGREALFALKDRADRRRARERALHLLDMRSHTAKELCDKLCKTVDEEIAQDTVQRMAELGLVDDADYARRLAQSLSEQRGWGAVRIRQRLWEKGVPREVADEALAELAQTTDAQAQLAVLLQKKYARRLGGERGVEKTIAALQRMGYRYGDIREALQAYAADAPDDADGDFDAADMEEIST